MWYGWVDEYEKVMCTVVGGMEFGRYMYVCGRVVRYMNVMVCNSLFLFPIKTSLPSKSQNEWNWNKI